MRTWLAARPAVEQIAFDPEGAWQDPAAPLAGRLRGDAALANDVGGRLAAHRHNLGPTAALLNNDGGGIFHFPPVAGQRDAFEEHVATPHGLDFTHAAALYGLEHTRAQTAQQLQDAIARSITQPQTDIIEVRTDR